MRGMSRETLYKNECEYRASSLLPNYLQMELCGCMCAGVHVGVHDCVCAWVSGCVLVCLCVCACACVCV